MQIKHLVISTLFIPLPLLSMESQFDAKLKKNLLSTYKAFQAISPNKECPQAPKPQTALNSTIIPSDNQADNSYETQEPTQRTKEFVQRALHSFNIPSDSIKISAFKYNVKNVAGNANPNQIKINEKWHGWNSDDTLTYLCFHEAGHVRDKANLKVVATIVAGQFATFAASGIAGFFITLKLIDMAPLELILKIPFITFYRRYRSRFSSRTATHLVYNQICKRPSGA